jgi:hypothetical protein
MARKWVTGIAIVCALGLAGCMTRNTLRNLATEIVGGEYMVKADAPTAGPPPDKALVYVMRPSGNTFQLNWPYGSFQVWDRDQFIGMSGAKSYFAYLCAPGRHLFIGIAENKVAVEADLAPGRSYYILTVQRYGAVKARLAMIPVTQGSEYWDKVDALKQELEFIVPVAERVQTWDAAKKAEVAGLVDFFEKDPEREKYITRLTPADGR